MAVVGEIRGKMTTSDDWGYVSITGPALVQPLVDLLAKLESFVPMTPNEVQTGRPENGYSMAIIILAALLFESALNRTAYIRNEHTSGPDYFQTLSSNQRLKDEIEEIYAVRNLIAHNHVWEAKVNWDENEGMKFTEPPKLREGYGDKRHLKVINPTSRKSSLLELNMFPARIWRRDAYIVLTTINKGITEIQSLDRKYFPLNNHLSFGNKIQTFHEILDGLSVPQDE